MLSSCLCTERAYHDGVAQGQRNFFAGRIIQSMLSRGYNHAKILDLMREWNERCAPPKPVNEFEDEVVRWIDGITEQDYNLSGCWWKFPEKGTHRNALRALCDTKYCARYRDKDEFHVESAGHPKINRKALTNSALRNATGSDYLIMTLLDVYGNSNGRRGFKVRDLRNKLWSSTRGEFYLKDRTLFALLSDLEQRNWIEITRNGDTEQITDTSKLKLARRMREFNNGSIQFLMTAANALINKSITKTEYKTYLALVRNLQSGKSCTYEQIANDLDMDVRAVRRYIKHLETERLLLIEKEDTTHGWQVNRYCIFFHTSESEQTEAAIRLLA